MYIKHIFLVLTLYLIYFLFSYNVFDGWYYSSIGSIAILTIGSYIWGTNFLNTLGLLNVRLLLFSFLIFFPATSFANFLGSYLAKTNTIEIISKTQLFKAYFHNFFYTFNEEVLLGAIPIYWLQKHLKLHPINATFLLAFYFATFHVIFYLSSDISLHEITFISIFTSGLVRNMMIIQQKSILGSWMIHFVWANFLWGNSHFLQESELTEIQAFEVYLGNYIFLILNTILFFIFFYIYQFKKHL
ncbi:MAG: hypothetical protein MUC49_03010 [Raineya sp.]|jgi:hypothetical protein|nr:hypothetical protein [Raineya sp.]